mgnify:FL=1
MLIVIEGVDASGKATQTKRLSERLAALGKKVHTVTFPDYESDSSAPVKMYLSGKLGETADSVNPYAASALFAVDRFCSYRTSWKKFLDSGDVVIADRYVTSNFIHQASKIKDPDEKEHFLSFQADFEYKKLGLPEPDKVLFLDVPPEVSLHLMKERENKFTHGEEKDIHERDPEYIKKSYENARFVADRFGFTRIDCTKDGKLKSIDEISDEIIKALM